MGFIVPNFCTTIGCECANPGPQGEQGPQGEPGPAGADGGPGARLAFVSIDFSGGPGGGPLPAGTYTKSYTITCPETARFEAGIAVSGGFNWNGFNVPNVTVTKVNSRPEGEASGYSNAQGPFNWKIDVEYVASAETVEPAFINAWAYFWRPPKGQHLRYDLLESTYMTYEEYESMI